jgi:hypothetical protein
MRPVMTRIAFIVVLLFGMGLFFSASAVTTSVVLTTAPEICYNFRAETPGQFHALPVVGGAMYVPEIRCNSAEVRIHVDDKAP